MPGRVGSGVPTPLPLVSAGPMVVVVVGGGSVPPTGASTQ
jgi:hypothetical protein